MNHFPVVGGRPIIDIIQDSGFPVNTYNDKIIIESDDNCVFALPNLILSEQETGYVSGHDVMLITQSLEYQFLENHIGLELHMDYSEDRRIPNHCFYTVNANSDCDLATVAAVQSLYLRVERTDKIYLRHHDLTDWFGSTCFYTIIRFAELAKLNPFMQDESFLEAMINHGL